MRIHKKAVLFFCTLSFVITTYGQTSTSSPYSHFGLGDLQDNIIPAYAGLGGGSTALYSAKYINPYNPASYTAFKSKTFLFSTGLSHLTTQMATIDLEQITNNTSFSHIIFGFPVSKNIGFSAGLIPFSSIGYTLNSTENNYNATERYTGDGNISKIYFGGAIKIHKDISFGVNASYLFGILNRKKEINFNDISIMDARSNSSINVRGYCYEFGIIYQNDFSGNNLKIGFTANNYNPKINSKRSTLVETFETVGDRAYVKDTVLESVESGFMTLPKFFALGASFERKNTAFVIDCSMQNWSEYRLFNESDDLKNTLRFSSGIEYVPDFQSPTNYFQRITYRFGISYANSPLKLLEESARHILPYDEKSFSFGFGLPMKRSPHNYDIFIELGQRGTKNDGLIQENFARLGVSVNYKGNWFNQRRYD